MTDRWRVTVDDVGQPHIRPIGDLVEHPLDEDCVCGPDALPVERDNGTIGFYIRHHSADGREQREQAS